MIRTMKEEIMKQFKKIYVLDTNIILDSPNNIRHLSQNGENLIVVSSIVTKELRKYKVGLDDLNYNARVFNRLLGDSEILETEDNRVLIKYLDNTEEVYMLLHKASYPNIEENDDKIVASALEIRDLYPDIELTLISNDIDVRTAAILVGLDTSILTLNAVKDMDFCFHLVIETEHNFKSGCSIERVEELTGTKVETEISSFEFYNPVTGKPTFFTRKNNHLEVIDETDLKKQKVNPINLPQKIMSSLILDDTIDIVVAEALAGSGKTLMALSSAMRLLDTKRDRFNKIIYIRKSVPSVDKESQIGFLKGSEGDKLKGFNTPLYDSLEYMVEAVGKGKKEKLTQESIQEGVEELINKYNIEFIWEGFLRGASLRNAVIIIDEASNFSRKSLQLILTRLGQGSKAIIIGSNRQNDSYYLNKYTNGLTHTMKLCCVENSEDVTLAGVKLEKAIRSKLAEWADLHYE